jgi:hypothetical protein
MDPLRRRWTALLAWMLLASVPLPGRSTELSVPEMGLARGDVVARIKLVEPLDVRTRSAVASGLPVTIRYSVDLWRDRRRWFDEHVDARVESFRIGWDPRERWYTLAYPGPGRRVDTYERLDDLLADLSIRDVPVHPRGALDENSRYFAVVEVAIRPLTLEEFRELDGWIGGKLGGGAQPSDAPAEGSDEGVSGAVLNFLLDMAGFGDRILETRTPPFRPGDLQALPGVDAGG